MLQIGKTNASTTAAELQPAFAWPQVESWGVALHQQIEASAQRSRAEIQEILTKLLQETEAGQASFAQRVVSDRLQDEDPAGLPYYHPAHWLQSHLEFHAQGILEYPTRAAAEQGFQAIRDQLRPEIARSLAVVQTEVSQLLDQHVHNICQSLAISLQPELKNQKVVLSEYINSYVPLPHMDLRVVERFSYFYNDKRLVPRELVTEVTKSVSPWYLVGLGRQQQTCYHIATAQVLAMVDESLRRSDRVMREQLDDYLQNDLRARIDRLFASIE